MDQEVVHLDQGHPDDCAIQLFNVSQEMMGIWAARYTIVTRAQTGVTSNQESRYKEQCPNL